MSEIYQKSFPVSWEELHRTSKALAWRLLEIGPFEGIVAVTRGGLVPAAIVARELEIRLHSTVLAALCSSGPSPAHACQAARKGQSLSQLENKM